MGFLGLEMPQWLLGIFIAYLIVAVLVVISQPFKAKNVTCSVANPFSAPAGSAFSCRYIYLTRSKSELRVV